MTPNYDRSPVLAMPGLGAQAFAAADILPALRARLTLPKNVLVVDCYPGIDYAELQALLRPLRFDAVFCSDDCALEPEKLDAAFAENLTEDRVFGMMTQGKLEQYFYPEKLDAMRRAIGAAPAGTILLYGVGAGLVCAGTLRVFAELTRWELQLRWRAGQDNWRTAQTGLPILAKYKRGFFIEWRLADRYKKRRYESFDFYLDMNRAGQPAMITGAAFREAMRATARRPFRLVPYFDPGVWGGHWMKDTFGLPENGANYAWSFDGVPEENSLKYDFDGVVWETPAQNLVLTQPRALLGERVHARFGAEFPIRFDYLDTMGGQNLSLQVHPLTEYIQENFGMHYTQDESYYMMQAGADACVYLGVKTGVDRAAMLQNLRDAESGQCAFDADRYINRFPVKKHDHVLIPAGTIHCSGKNAVVLEISATPYIFTFKLWDWDRLGLDGLPRPVHLQHGAANIQWDRDTEWAERELLHQEKPLHRAEGVLVERTGLHEREFIDTFRFTLSAPAVVRRNGSVHMLNLIEGRSLMVQSPTGAWEAYTVHYGETFILPAGAGEYRLVPGAENEGDTMVILACVRG